MARVVGQPGASDSPTGSRAEDTNPAVAEAEPSIEDSSLARVITAALAAAPADSPWSLSATGLEIRSLAGIELLRSLEVLDVSQNEITDLSPLGLLTNLVLLVVTADSVTDLGPLRTLGQLEVLLLAGNAVQDLEPLSGLTHLKELVLTGNPLGDDQQALVPQLLDAGVTVENDAPGDNPAAGPVLDESAGLVGFDWSPFGDRLIFASTREDPLRQSAKVYVSKPDGSDLEAITDFVTDQ